MDALATQSIIAAAEARNSQPVKTEVKLDEKQRSNPLLQFAPKIFERAKTAAKEHKCEVAVLVADHKGIILAQEGTPKATPFFFATATGKIEFLRANNLDIGMLCNSLACGGAQFSKFVLQGLSPFKNSIRTMGAHGALLIKYKHPTDGDVTGFLSVGGCSDDKTDVKVAEAAAQAAGFVKAAQETWKAPATANRAKGSGKRRTDVKVAEAAEAAGFVKAAPETGEAPATANGAKGSGKRRTNVGTVKPRGRSAARGD